MQILRDFARLLGLRARLEMAEGQFDKAVYTLQTGFALARHLDEAPTLLCDLIGIAIASVMSNQIEDMIQLPGAPNLYWALTDLPRPFISLRRGFQSEKITIDSLFPEIRTAMKTPNSGPMSLHQVNDSLHKLNLIAAMSSEGEGGYEMQGMRFGAAIMAAKIYPEAKRYLIKQGRTPAQVDALPVVQVALMYALAKYDVHFDNFYKWYNVPFWESGPGLNKAIKQLKESKSKIMETGGIPIAELILPAVQNVVLARTRLDRRIAVLRCIEAIRLYAADHQGKLPESLSDIKEVPIPIDPFTGKNFEYRLEKGKAILVGPPPASQPLTDRNTIRFELTLAPAGKDQE
jgi:hypothetical protein